MDRMMEKTVFSILLALAGSALVAADTLEFVLSEPSQKRILVREISRVMVHEYTPPFEVSMETARGKGHYESPESTLSAAISAAAAGDFGWAYETMSPRLREKKENESAEKKRKGEELFDSIFRGNQVFLTHKAIAGELTLLRTEVKDGKTGGVIFRYFFPFRFDQGRWWQVLQSENATVSRFRMSFDPLDLDKPLTFSNGVVGTPSPPGLREIRVILTQRGPDL